MGRHHVRKPPYVPVRVPQLRFKTMLATVTRSEWTLALVERTGHDDGR